MKYQLYTDVELQVDVIKFNLKKGDVVKIIDYSDKSYVLEAFNVLGETIGVFMLSENQIKKLQKNKVFSTRDLEFV
jgi:bifunctional DNA-binding transcriptional regulator/antitoxin component of YhaV-PrlF toxin-antitoxin module